MEYLFIRAWGRFMGSYQHDIDNMVERAKQEHAPYNSLHYCDTDKKWITLDMCKNHDTCVTIRTLAKQMTEPAENMTINPGMFGSVQLPMITVEKYTCQPGHVGFHVFVDHAFVGNVERHDQLLPASLSDWYLITAGKRIDCNMDTL
jgi:hypothetical protein